MRPLGLSIVTAADRNMTGLQRVYESVKPCLGRGVEWVIKDSGRCPATVDWFRSIDSENISFESSIDSGIYDALNHCIARASAPHYLVVGTDDRLDSEVVLRLLSCWTDYDRYDIIVTSVLAGGKIRMRRKYRPLFISVSGLVASHSVGTIIRRELHESFGPYDCRYRILADSLFLTRCAKADVSIRFVDDVILGEFGVGGVSSTDREALAHEALRYQSELGASKLIQYPIFLMRMVRNWVNVQVGRISIQRSDA